MTNILQKSGLSHSTWFYRYILIYIHTEVDCDCRLCKQWLLLRCGCDNSSNKRYSWPHCGGVHKLPPEFSKYFNRNIQLNLNLSGANYSNHFSFFPQESNLELLLLLSTSFNIWQKTIEIQINLFCLLLPVW